VSESRKILEVRKLSAGYGRSRVLFDLDIEARSPGMIAILGRNGAGKTTLLKTLAGEIRPMAGEIVFDGRDAVAEATERRAEEIADRLVRLSKELSLILVEQHVELALRVADYVYVMDRGTIALEGSAAQVKDDPGLLRYLAP
jgi:ABC-type branched-subunit amino acid transport system ATPase component